MRHKVSRHRLNEKPGHGRMVERNLVTSLFLYEEIRTTRHRARVIQPLIDNFITTAKKKEPQQAIRAINAFVTDKNACRKLIEVLKPRYATRTSGFTRMKAVGARKGDGAELVDLSLVDSDTSKPVAAPKKKATVKKKPAKESTESTAS